MQRNPMAMGARPNPFCPLRGPMRALLHVHSTGLIAKAERCLRFCRRIAQARDMGFLRPHRGLEAPQRPGTVTLLSYLSHYLHPRQTCLPLIAYLDGHIHQQVSMNSKRRGSRGSTVCPSQIVSHKLWSEGVKMEFWSRYGPGRAGDSRKIGLRNRFNAAVRNPPMMMLYPPVSSGEEYRGQFDLSTMWRGVSGDASVYIHIPFCQTRCVFCPFHATIAREEHFEAYINSLMRELAQYSGSVKDLTSPRSTSAAARLPYFHPSLWAA